MTLKKWVNDEGREKIAKKLKVSQATISLWVNKKSAPKDKLKIMINRLSHGRVSYAEMIEPFHGDL